MVQKLLVLLLVLLLSAAVGYGVHAAVFCYTQWEKIMIQRMSDPHTYYAR